MFADEGTDKRFGIVEYQKFSFPHSSIVAALNAAFEAAAVELLSLARRHSFWTRLSSLAVRIYGNVKPNKELGKPGENEAESSPGEVRESRWAKGVGRLLCLNCLRP